MYEKLVQANIVCRFHARNFSGASCAADSVREVESRID